MEIDSTEMKKLYSPKFLNEVKEGRPTVVDLNYGKLLKFEIFYEEDKFTDFFHVTYGE